MLLINQQGNYYLFPHSMHSKCNLLGDYTLLLFRLLLMIAPAAEEVEVGNHDLDGRPEGCRRLRQQSRQPEGGHPDHDPHRDLLCRGRYHKQETKEKKCIISHYSTS